MLPFLGAHRGRFRGCCMDVADFGLQSSGSARTMSLPALTRSVQHPSSRNALARTPRGIRLILLVVLVVRTCVCVWGGGLPHTDGSHRFHPNCARPKRKCLAQTGRPSSANCSLTLLTPRYGIGKHCLQRQWGGIHAASSLALWRMALKHSWPEVRRVVGANSPTSRSSACGHCSWWISST